MLYIHLNENFFSNGNNAETRMTQAYCCVSSSKVFDRLLKKKQTNVLEAVYLHFVFNNISKTEYT